MWELPNGKKQSLVSEWKDSSGQDYDKKLRNWIAYANLHKLQKNAN